MILDPVLSVISRCDGWTFQPGQAEDIDRLVADSRYIGHILAFYLLSQFRERRAYPLIVEFFSIPGDVTLEVTGDFVTEALQRVLASVSGGDMEPMLSLAEDASANEFVRTAGVGAMTCLFVEGLRDRDEVIAALRGLFRGGLERERSYVWAALVSETTHLHAEELMGDVRRAFANDLFSEQAIDLDFVEGELAANEDVVLARLREDQHYHFIQDTIAEMEWWACFPSSPEDVGRNDPCPCGSGMKYKRCCGDPRL